MTETILIEADEQLDSAEKKLIEEAAEWVIAHVSAKHECYFCGASWANLPASKQGRQLKSHLTKVHPYRSIDCLRQETLDPTLRNDPKETASELIESMQVEQLDRFDYLTVPENIKRRIANRGGKTYWAAPDRIEYWKRQGATLVPTVEGVAKQEGHPADGTTRTNEMVLMELPPELVEKRRRVKAARAQNAPATCKEQMLQSRSVAGKKVFELAIAGGMSKTEALNLANAVERGQTEGRLTPTLARLTVMDQTGRKDF